MSKKFFKKFENGDFRVTIFGSARIKKETQIYNQIKTLAKMLGERGFDIVTGGGPGLMEAASSGHEKGSKKTGAHSIGIGIKLPKRQGFNMHLNVKKEFNRFSERLDTFMSLSNVVVVAPGGVGTLLELFYAWQLVQVKHICDIPIILLGEQWPSLIKWLEKNPLKNKYLDKKDINLLFLAKNCDEAMKMIDNAHKEHKQGNKNFCLNYKKYKLY
ncbi:MAG TPA: LOG family protein [Candidatus Nanoarchaeia archaeon]|nr:LOG family protein [Candidatus Nanoarchaeia archaeon]